MATTVLGLKTFTASDPVDYNEVNDNYVKIDNGVKTAMQGRAAHNILDNSDFSIAQAGQNGSHGSTKYVCDRWISWSADATFGDWYITPGSPIDQRFYLSNEQANKTHTAVLYMADGTVKYNVGKPIDSFGLYSTVYCGVSDAATNRYFLRIGSGQNVKSAALYEGSYTADTLPAYVPKGYAAELAECQSYYRTMGFPVIPCGNNPAGTQVYGFLPFIMRIDNPTVSCDTLYYFKGDTNFSSVSSASAASYGAGTRIVFNISSSVEGNLAGVVAGNGITLSADL